MLARCPTAVLEVGCGRGSLLALLADQVPVLHGVDRSATAVAAARAHLDGRVVLHAVELAALGRSLVAGEQFDVVVAVNVNLFWTRESAEELRVMRRLLRPGGEVHLVYDPPAGRADDVLSRLGARLAPHGLQPAVERAPEIGDLVRVVLRPSG